MTRVMSIDGTMFASCAFAALLSIMAVETARADTDSVAGKDPADVVEEIVDDAEEGKDGLMHPSTGKAEPTENWFGCKPDEDDQAEACETDDDDEADEEDEKSAG